MPTEYGFEQGEYLVTNQYESLGVVLAFSFPTVDAADEVSQDLKIPAGALIDRARFGVVAVATDGLVQASDVADVRPSAPLSSAAQSAVVVDFGRMVSIGSVAAGLHAVHAVRQWNGTSFGFASPGVELRTERLLVEFDSDLEVATIESVLTVTLPATPGDLELAVNGTTVWFQRQGSSPGADALELQDDEFHVDRTDEVRRAFEAGGSPVRVTLRASSPGTLTLTPKIGIRRVHAVAFSEGPSRTLQTATEGPFTLSLPLPAAESAGWQVDSVELVSRATLPPDRVLPSVGPSINDDARLVVAPARPLLGRIPPTQLARLATLSGVRLAVRGGDEGGELGGRLVLDDGGKPGEAADGGVLTPAVVEPGAEVTWVTLATATPVASAPLWLELQASYGEVEWAMTAAGPLDPSAPGTAIHRRLPSGAMRPMTVVGDIGALYGALRLVGIPEANQPIEALSLSVTSDPDEPIAITPTTDGVPARIGFEAPITPVAGALEVSATAAVAGSFAFEAVRVTYKEA